MQNCGHFADPTYATLQQVLRADTCTFQGNWVAPNGDEQLGRVPVARAVFDPPIFRPPVLGDPEPVFSNCSLPIIFYKEYASNYGHSLFTILPQIYHWYHHRAVNEYVSYVVSSLCVPYLCCRCFMLLCVLSVCSRVSIIPAMCAF